MTDLSPAAEAVLNAVTLKRYDVPYQACPASIDQIKADAAAVLWAAATFLRSEEFETCGGCSYALMIEVDDLLAIAAELKGTTTTRGKD